MHPCTAARRRPRMPRCPVAQPWHDFSSRGRGRLQKRRPTSPALRSRYCDTTCSWGSLFVSIYVRLHAHSGLKNLTAAAYVLLNCRTKSHIHWRRKCTQTSIDEKGPQHLETSDGSASRKSTLISCSRGSALRAGNKSTPTRRATPNLESIACRAAGKKVSNEVPDRVLRYLARTLHYSLRRVKHLAM